MFNHNGALLLLHQGKLIPVGRDVINQIIAEFVVTERLVNHGTDNEPNWKINYQPFTPAEPIIRQLLSAPDRKSGSLIARATKISQTITPQACRASSDWQ